MTTLECIKRSEVLLAPPKYSLRITTRTTHGRILRTETANGMEEMPPKMASAMRGMGMTKRGREERREGDG